MTQFFEIASSGLTPEERSLKRQETRLVRKALVPIASRKARGADP